MPRVCTSAAPRAHIYCPGVCPTCAHRPPRVCTSAAPRRMPRVCALLPRVCPAYAPRMRIGRPACAHLLPRVCTSAAPHAHTGCPAYAPRVHAGCPAYAPRAHTGCPGVCPTPWRMHTGYPACVHWLRDSTHNQRHLSGTKSYIVVGKPSFAH
eukprot:2021532-Pyramimonas_sp.AAC.1